MIFFKAYRKLVEDLKYDVVAIYNIEWMPEDQKKIITAKVRDGYRMYLESIGETIEEKKVDILDNDDTDNFSPLLLKELEKYTKIIDDSIVKIQNLLIKNHEIITEEQKAVLERIEIELVQIKWVRNIGKIQSTLEESLKRIGAVEIEILKKWMIKEKAKFLAETNKLLQWVGSSEKIKTDEEKEASIEYKVSNFFKNLANKKTDKPVKENKVDTNSFIYFKNKRELDIYKKSFQKNNSALIKAIFSGNFTLVRRLILKRRLLLQNIQIIENRLENKAVSYTKIAHGFDYYIQMFFAFINTFGTIFSVALFLYVLVYIISHSLAGMGIIQVEIVNKSALFLTLFSLFVFWINVIRWWKSLIVIIPVLIYIFSFLSLNF